MIATDQTGNLLQVTISGEWNFAVTRELLLICKTRLHEGKITRIEILLEKVTSFDSCAIGAMLLLSDWVHGDFHIYVDNCSPPLFSPLSGYLHDKCQFPDPTDCINLHD